MRPRNARTVDAPVYAFGLTAQMVPATDYAPRLTAPLAPVDVWFWQFNAVEADEFDTVASRTRVDCQADTYQFLGHAAYLQKKFIGSERYVGQPVRPSPGSAAAGLMTHICEPDPEREFRRYTNRRTARKTFDDFFAGR